MNNKVVLGCDKNGFELKEKIKHHLVELGYEVIDFGTSFKGDTDYLDIALLVGKTVAKNKHYVGIMVDEIGISSGMVLNKIPNVRCAVCWDILSTIHSRQYYNANVLSLGANYLGAPIVIQMVTAWLQTKFLDEKYDHKVTKIQEIESRFIKE